MEDSVKLDFILNQIITDRRFVTAMDGDGNSLSLMVRNLTSFETSYSQHLYNTAMSRCKAAGILTEKEALADAMSKELWSEDKDKLIKLNEMEVKRLKAQQTFYKHNKGRVISLSNEIKRLKQESNELTEQKYALLENTAETSASSIQNGYIVSRMVLKEDGSQLWPTYDDYLNESDSKLISSIATMYRKLPAITETDIRKVARSGKWSIMWNSAKTGNQDLFSRPATEYTHEQSMLCYWSMMYDSVYESTEKPSDKVIEDDVALDKWFLDQKKKVRSESTNRLGKNKDHPEQFIMAQSDEDADNIYGMNDQWSLARVRAEKAKIREKQGMPVPEIELVKAFKPREQLVREEARRSGNVVGADGRRQNKGRTL